jgi:hypothetical protein
LRNLSFKSRMHKFQMVSEMVWRRQEINQKQSTP